jgi:hypothetical protein
MYVSSVIQLQTQVQYKYFGSTIDFYIHGKQSTAQPTVPMDAHAPGMLMNATLYSNFDHFQDEYMASLHPSLHPHVGQPPPSKHVITFPHKLSNNFWYAILVTLTTS